MVRRRRTNTAAAEVRALCRPLAHAGRAPQRNDIDGHGDHGGPTDSNGPCHRAAAGSLTPNGRAGLSGTASRLGPADWPPLAHRTTSRRWPARWPAGLPGSARRRSAAGRWRGSNGALR